MQFEEAKDKLKELAEGQYHEIQYSLLEEKNGEQRTSCFMLICGNVAISAKKPIFQECLDDLARQLRGKVTEEIPNVDG
jgi:hypothetical protein